MPLELIMAFSPIASKLNNYGELTEHLTEPWRNSFFAVFFAE